MNKQEFMKKHDQRIMDEIKRSPLSKLIDRITNTKRDIYGHRIYSNDALRRLVIKHLDSIKDEVMFFTLANRLDTHWIRLKQVMFTQKLVSTPDGIKMHRESLIEGWEPVWRDYHIYFKRTKEMAGE